MVFHIVIVFPTITLPMDTYVWSAWVRSYDVANSPQCYMDLAFGAPTYSRHWFDNGADWEYVRAVIKIGTTVSPFLKFNCPSNRAVTFGIDNVGLVPVTSITSPELLSPAFRYDGYCLYFCDSLAC